jgi:hypothetical protein
MISIFRPHRGQILVEKINKLESRAVGAKPDSLLALSIALIVTYLRHVKYFVLNFYRYLAPNGAMNSNQE